ncbi:unnamed protein product [Linum tenue]|uniref:Uncharacterized protein n=1 Tax=Linum tenue TaxID=586396 RepID=A0AAV0IS31_9ROSI|nr:unnamed protein product [Linum tenue]
MSGSVCIQSRSLHNHES